MNKIEEINKSWKKQLAEAKMKYTTPYPSFKRRASANAVDSPITHGWHPVSSQHNRDVKLPHHPDNLERISKRYRISVQDWKHRMSRCPQCGASMCWVHPGYGKRVCDRCTAEFE